MADEQLFPPLETDFRVENNTFNIIKGLRNIVPYQAPKDTSLDVSIGDWVVKNDSGVLVAIDSTARENCYPVWDGFTPDVKVTGVVTYLLRNGFVVKTTKYDPGQTYAAGDLLCVKDVGGGVKLPTKASTGEYFVAVVDEPINNGVLTIKIVEGGMVP